MSANPFLRATLDAINSALAQGDLATAEARCERLLQNADAPAEAHNLKAMIAIRRGQPAAALALLQATLGLFPSDPLTLNNLGQLCAQQGDDAGAVLAFSQLLEQQPQHFASRLQKGLAQQRLGDSYGALVAFSRAIHDAQAQGRWRSDETTAPSLREPVRHAMQTVRAGTRELFSRCYQPLKQQFGREALARVDTCLAMHLGDIPLTTTDPRQQPTFLYFPGLPTTPYLPRQDFAFIAALEAQTAVIQAELQALLPQQAGREQVFHNQALAQENLHGLYGPPSWNGYYFYRYGQLQAGNASACPHTVAALQALPLAQVPGHAPEVLFSVFAPGTHLLKHRGVTNTRVVGHLPLLIPPDCALSVADQPHVWKEGEVVVFDDSYEHEAWNRSQHTRVVLIFDLHNPYLTEVEQLAVAQLVVALGDFRNATEAP